MARKNDAFAKLVSVVASVALVVGLTPLPAAAFTGDGAADASNQNAVPSLAAGTIANTETPFSIGAQSTGDVVQVNTWDGLQDAIDNANNGRVIQLSDNVVNPASNGTGIPLIDNMLDLDFKSGIKVKNKTVTIDLAGYTLDRDLSSVRNSGHVIEVFDGAELTITDSSENKTGKICGGYSKWGGGIFVNENATLIIRGGTITGNTAGERGGGIYAKKNSTVVIEGGAIANNETKNKAGGGIYVLGKLTMTGGRIEGNEANESGGGIFAGEESFISLTDAVITGNKAGENGGGINVKSQTGSIIKNCEITGNRAHKYGGGLYVDEEGRTLTIIGARTKIDDNKASGAYGSSGGGIAIAEGTVKMTYGTISGNIQEGYYGGGGVWVWGQPSIDAQFIADGVTISNNHAEGDGGGLRTDFGGATLTRCSVTGNSAVGDGGGINNGAAGTDLILDDCTVTGNSSEADGGGIYGSWAITIRNGGLFTGNTAAGKGGGIFAGGDIAGPIFITDNTAASGEDLYLGKGRKLKLTGDIEGSRIGSIDMEQVGVFTELYSDFHPNVEPRTFFGTDGMTLPVVWSDDHTEAQLSSNWPALQAMIADAEAHPNDPTKNPVVLQNDYIASSADIKLKVNGTVTIDLNGHTINRNLQHKGSDGQVIEVYGGAALTIVDNSANKTGKITGGWPDRGGGIYVNKNAELAIGGGAITGNHSEKAGGGIYVLGNLTMTGGRIKDNIAGESGGGIFAGAESSINLKDAVITSNTAHDNGGAIKVKSQTDSSIENCEITANRADKCGGGVNVDMDGATLTVSGTSTKIDDNKAGDDGGGIYLAHGTVAMTEGSISRNTAANDSGAVKVNGDDAILAAESVTIEENKAQAKEAGGIKNWGTTTLVNCTVKDNTAKLQGGGIYNGSYDSSPGKLTLEGCTISGNSTRSDGGGVYSSNKLSMKGGEISGNSARRGGGVHIGGDAKETNVEGAVVVQGNSASERGNDMFLHSGKKLTCTGALTSGAAIGVDLENGAGVLTKDYGKKNGTTDPSLHFVATAGYEVLLNDDGEVEFGSDWAEIKSQIENAEDGKTVPLTKDYTALPSDDAIFIQSGKSVTVDLNGHSLNRNRHSSEREGYVFEVSGNLTLKDNSSNHAGTVTGGWAKEGGGILVKGTGALNFESGTICGNKAGAGGGISNYGTLNMTGGIVRDNVSEGSGGGINLAVYGKLNFEAGIISDNSAAEYGGGIQAGHFTEVSIKGKPVVYSNKAKFAGGDVYLTFINDVDAGIEFWPRINVTGELQPGAEMGIALEEDSMVHVGGYEFTRGYSNYNSGKDPAWYFTSTEGYAISLSENGEAVMKPSSHGETEHEKPFIDIGDQINTGSLNNRNWMSGISGERYLNEINIPGTHDAGMKNVQALDTLEDPSWVGWIAPQKSAMFATTQISTIAQQLDAGSRQLDIRLSNRKKVHEGSNRRYVWEDDGWSLWVCHGKDDTLVGTYYALREDEVLLSLADVLMDVEAFLSMHPTETVMLNLRVENGDAGKIRQRARTILEEFNHMNPATREPYLYKESGSDSYFAPYTHMPRLKDCRGKIVLLLGDEEFRETVGGFDAEEMVSDSDGTAWDDYKLTPSNLIDTVTRLYNHLNPGSNSKPLPTNATAGDYPLWYWELNCTSEEEGEWDTYVAGDEGPIDNANIVNPTLIGDEKLFGPLVNGQYIGWVRLDAFEAKYAEPIWRTNFPGDLEYRTVTVESGLGNPNYATQVYKVLKGTRITIPGNIYKNLDNKYLRCWGAKRASTNTSTTPEVWYPGETFVVEESVKFEAQWMDEGQIPVTVIWKDGDNTDGLRPDANDGLTLNVTYGDGSTKPMVIKEEQGWSGIVAGDVKTIIPQWSLIDLNAGDGFGQDAVGQYRYELSHQSGTGFVLTVIHTPQTMISTAGSVVWNDDEDAERIRPTSANVHLSANGTEIASGKVTAADGWDFDFTLKPKYKDGEEIDYKVTEDRVEGYSTVIDGFSVINTHVTLEQNSTDVIGIVEWDDGNDARGERPKSVTVHLKANGEERESKTVKASEYGLWNFSFNGVPIADSQGRDIAYSITVDEVSGYTSGVESPSGYAFRVMNTLIVDPDDKEPATLAQAPRADDLVYTGDEQPLVTEGSCSGGTLMYALGGDSESAPPAESYGTELPAETDANVYHVWYYVKGDVFHTDTVPACVTATIGKRPATITVDNASKEQGENDPTFTGTVKGLAAEDDLGEIRYIRTNEDEAPGTYADVLNAEYTANPNYDVTVSKGDFTITKPSYSVRFDANVPTNASTTCSGTMEDQSFAYDEKKALSANGYTLPGYDFVGWNTKVDGTGSSYVDGIEVESLTDAGGTVVLYAQWSAKAYVIEFKPGDIGGDVHKQTAYFDQPSTLEAYSDTTFSWNSGGRTLHGWAGAGFGSYYRDGENFVNLCGAPDADGNLTNVELTAEWVQNGQIIVTVTKDGVPQGDLVDKLSLVDESGTKFSVAISYKGGKYTFDPSNAVQPGGEPAQLPLGAYDLSFESSGYPKATAHIVYGKDSAASAVFAYYTVSLAEDPDYADFHEVSISGGEPVVGEANMLVALDGSKLTIATTVAEGYRFTGYTAAGVPPAWEGGDSSKAIQDIEVQGKADIAAHVAPLEYSVTVEGGTADKATAKAGEIVMVTANAPEPGKAFAQWAHIDGVDFANASSTTTTFTMPAKDVTATAVIAPIVIEAIDDKMYIGSPIEPFDEVKVSLEGVDLVLQPEDYEISFDDNVDAGDAMVTVTMKSPRAGSATSSFKIAPKPATIKVSSASKLQGDADPAFAGTVEGLVASGDLGEVSYKRTNDDEAPGIYEGVITAEYAANPNYDVLVTNGDFTIKKRFIVRWLDGDGSVLQSKYYSEDDEPPAYDGKEPTKAATAQYTYMFTGWDGGTVEDTVTTYKPLFSETVREYTVRFVNDDGTELQSGKLAYGETPEYKGETPKKAETERSTYEFAGWTPKIAPVTGDATYTASFAEKAKPGVYELVSSSGSTWTEGSSDPLTFTIKRTVDDDTTIDHYGGVEVDGKTIPEKDSSGKVNYTAKKGSAIVSLQPSFLATLAYGDHTVKVIFDDGNDVEVPFKKVEKAAPTPGSGGTTKSNGSTTRGNGSTTKSNLASTGDASGGAAAALTIAAACALCLAAFALRQRRRHPFDHVERHMRR